MLRVTNTRSAIWWTNRAFSGGDSCADELMSRSPLASGATRGYSAAIDHRLIPLRSQHWKVEPRLAA